MRKYSVTGIVFSPTGTSKTVIRSVIDGIDPNAQIIDSTHSCTDRLFGQNDIVILSAPVYGGHMPAIVRERWQNIRGNNTPAVIIGVYGNRDFEKAVTDMADFIIERGFIPIAAAAFIGEHSYSTTVYPIATGRPDKTDIAKGFEFGLAISKKIENDISEIDASALPRPHTPEKSLDAFKEFVSQYQINRQVNPVKLIPITDSNSCIDCGACVEVCPVDAISNDGKSTESSKCIKCCACVKTCSTGAKSFSSPFAPVLSENFAIRREPVYIL